MCNSHAVAMDNYFKTLNPKTAPRTPEGDIDYESPLCLDMDLLDRALCQALPGGRRSSCPASSLPARCATTAWGTPLKLEKNEIAIFEGIHALNDDIAGRAPGGRQACISPPAPT